MDAKALYKRHMKIITEQLGSDIPWDPKIYAACIIAEAIRNSLDEVDSGIDPNGHNGTQNAK